MAADARRSALTICGLFVAAGGVWLGLLAVLDRGSDAAGNELLRDAAFLAIAAVLLYVLIRRALAPALADEHHAAGRPRAPADDAERFAAIGRMSAGVVHDVNNVLAAIGGYAELALRRSDAADPAYADLLAIRRAADRGAHLARRVLEQGRRPDPRPEVLDLNAVLVDIGRMLPRLMGERCTVSVEPASRPALVLADLSDIEQVVLNLALNAREAMSGGGRLVVHADVHDDSAGSRVELVVSDSGRGMDEATAARAFEPFFSTRAEGTGLGLAAVAAIVQRAGGSVTCESQPGHGATFRVKLPAAQGAPASQPLAAESLRAPGEAPSGTVLVVDDDAALCDVLARMLRDGGYAARTAGDGRRAIDALAGGGIDVLLVDMLMPDKEGLETIADVRQRWPGLPVIAMSGALRGDSYLGMALKLGAVGSLRKPFGREALLAAVAAARRPGGPVPREEAGTA